MGGDGTMADEIGMLTPEQRQLFSSIYEICTSWDQFSAQPQAEIVALEEQLEAHRDALQRKEAQLKRASAQRGDGYPRGDERAQLDALKAPVTKLEEEIEKKKRLLGRRQAHDISLLSTLLAQVRQLHREAGERAVQSRDNVFRARASVEATQLALQNQTYMRNHLKAEIERCKAFRSIYQDTDLHPREEFFEKAPRELTDAITDDHTEMLARLQFELAERERLDAELKALQAEKAEASRIAKAKKAGLKRLEPDLANMVNAAGPIGEALDKFLA